MRRNAEYRNTEFRVISYHNYWMDGTINMTSSNRSKREWKKKMIRLEKDGSLSASITYSAANLTYNTMYLYVMHLHVYTHIHKQYMHKLCTIVNRNVFHISKVLKLSISFL